MKRDQYYRSWCSDCKEFVRWVEPTGRVVDKILCPGCGKLLPSLKGTNIPLKGELISNARTYVEGNKRGKG